MATRRDGADADAEETAKVVASHLPSSALLDALVPPKGYDLDRSLCSTYSAQSTVLVAMLMAMSRYSTVDGTGGSSGALAKSLRSLLGRVHFLVQHGRWASPRKYSPILHMLDRFVVQVEWDERERSWHPKVCVLRFVSPDPAQTVRWRIWLGSRNFTRDRSWDLALCLEGAVGGKGQELSGIDVLTERLALQAGVLKPWRKAIGELPGVRWATTTGIAIDEIALDLPGDDRSVPVLPADTTRAIVVSPFLHAPALRELKSGIALDGSVRREVLTLVSSESALAEVASQTAALDGFVLQSLPSSSQESFEYEEVGERQQDLESDSLGLHAKFIWLERPGRIELTLGSTNLTQRGWLKNAEVRAELSMKRRGSAHVLALRNGIEAFLDVCEPVSVDRLPTPDPAGQRAERRFNRLRNAIVAELRLRQRLNADRTVLVTAEAAPQLPPGARLRVARVGGALADWLPGASVVLPESPDHDNGDALRIELQWGEDASGWLHFAPFAPPQDKEARDRALLQGMLGLDGLIELLNDLLRGGAAGNRRASRPWDEEVRVPRPPARLLGIEIVLAAWVRDRSALGDVAQAVAMIRDYQPGNPAERKAHADLKQFLSSWDAIESELLGK